MTVYRLIKAGELAAVRVGHDYRIREGDVERYLASSAPSTWKVLDGTKGRIGLDIGSTAVRAAELLGRDAADGGPRGQVASPPARSRSGEVRDPLRVSDALRELW